MEQVNEIIARMVQAQYGSPNHSAFVEKHMGEYLAKWPSYKDRFTHLEWYHLFLDAIESYDSCTASECDRLKAELEKERTTGRQEWERLQLDKIDSLKEELDNTQKELADIQINLSTAEDQIDSLKEENERIKKELTYFKEGAELYARECCVEAIRVARENMIEKKRSISRPFTEEEILKIVGL